MGPRQDEDSGRSSGTGAYPQKSTETVFPGVVPGGSADLQVLSVANLP